MPSSFVLPQQTVFNEFLQFPSELTDAMRPMIIGGQAELTRYSEASEKVLALLGAYDPLLAHTHPYPNRIAGSVVDQGYTKLWADDALLKYLDKPVGVQGTVAPVSGHANQVRASALTFKSNGTTYPRSTIFGDRDCQVGDVVDLRFVVSSVEYDKRTSIAGFVADTIAASVGAATGAATNETDQSASATATKVAGVNNRVQAAASATNYDGSITGETDETYTVEVTTGSVGGNLTTARLKVTSASGDDDNFPTNADGTVGVKVAAASSPTLLTNRGATLTFSINGALPVDSGVTANDLYAGMRWTVVVHQAWTAPVATSGGTYTGPSDTTYVVTVQTGGAYLTGAGAQQGPQTGLIGPQYAVSGPTILVTTTTGIDAGGPYAVSGPNVAVPIGAYGVTVKFSGTELRKGDAYLIPVTAAASGPYNTLVLQDNIQDGALTATDGYLKLYIKDQGLLIAHDRVSSPPLTNWSQDGTNITVASGIQAYDKTYTFGGVQYPLPLVEGTLYVETRQWKQDLVNNIGSLSSVAEIRSKIGTIHPDNPLAWGLNQAILNAAGSVLWYGAVSAPDVTQAWIDFLDAITNVTGFYHIVPLTHDQDVLKEYAAHVVAQSAPEVGAFRAGWFALKSRPTKPAVDATTTADHATALATVTADTVTGLLTLLKVPAGNADFVTNGVKAGDIVRYAYTTDGFGNVAYSQVAVGGVVNEDTLNLATPVATAITTASKIEVWHPMSNNDIRDDLIAQAAQYKSQRTRAVWPDQADGNAGYFLCAGLAGLASGVAIHQGLKNLQLVGFTTLQSQTQKLTASNVKKLIDGGVWVVDTDPLGFIYTKAATTTDTTSTLTTEEVINRNADAQVFFILSRVQQFTGVSNVVDGTVKLVRGAIKAALNFIQTATTNAMRLGPPLLGATILDLRQHTLLKDKIVCTLQLRLPYPFNQLVVTVQLVA